MGVKIRGTSFSHPADEPDGIARWPNNDADAAIRQLKSTMFYQSVDRFRLANGEVYVRRYIGWGPFKTVTYVKWTETIEAHMRP